MRDGTLILRQPPAGLLVLSGHQQMVILTMYDISVIDFFEIELRKPVFGKNPVCKTTIIYF